MLATLSLVIRHEAIARRGETIYKKRLPLATTQACVTSIILNFSVAKTYFLSGSLA